MTFIVSPYLPFPPLAWWAFATGVDAVLLDGEEHFIKATARNRYRIATANGLLQLSIPLQGGRRQRSAVKELRTDTSVSWQEQHWRSIRSAYGRAPYFEHYAPGLEALFLRKVHTHLAAFCIGSMEWLSAAIRIPLRYRQATAFKKEYPDAILDWRFGAAEMLSGARAYPRYPQVFEDHHGFLPNLSLLDLLMNEGPGAVRYIAQLKMV